MTKSFKDTINSVFFIKIKNLATGSTKIYKSITEASYYENIPRSSIYSVLDRGNLYLEKIKIERLEVKFNEEN